MELPNRKYPLVGAMMQQVVKRVVKSHMMQVDLLVIGVVPIKVARVLLNIMI
jgi:hypothetical protein